jgi:ABC-type glycerol-3-phosphate transport system substrate-binding protein
MHSIHGKGDRLSRRSIVQALLATAGVTALTPLLAACGSASGQPAAAASSAGQTAATGGTATQAAATGSASTAAATAPASGATTLHFYTSTAAANLPTWNKAIADFMQQNPAIHVQLDYTPGQQYWDKLTVEYAGGTAPDVIYSGPSNAQDVATKGMVLDLTSYINQDKYNLSDINPASQQPYQWGGKIWGLCAFTDTRYTIYNKTMFKAAGLPDLPQTWDGDFSLDQFVSYAQKLTDPSKQTWGYVFEDQLHAAHFSWLFDSYYWDSTDYPTKAVMDSASGQEGFQFIQDLVYKYKVAPTISANMGGSDAMFATGKVGMVWGGYKSAAVVDKPIKAFEWGISTIPMGKKRVSNLSPNGFQIISKSKAPADAWKLVQYITGSEGEGTLSAATSMPANRTVDFNKVSPLQPWQNTLLQAALKSGLADDPHPNIKPQMLTIMSNEIDALMANSETGAQAAKNMAAKINAIFQPYVVAK